MIVRKFFCVSRHSSFSIFNYLLFNYPFIYCFIILLFLFFLPRADREEMRANATRDSQKSQTDRSNLVGNIHGQDIEAAKQPVQQPAETWNCNHYCLLDELLGNFTKLERFSHDDLNISISKATLVSQIRTRWQKYKRKSFESNVFADVAHHRPSMDCFPKLSCFDQAATKRGSLVLGTRLRIL